MSWYKIELTPDQIYRREGEKISDFFRQPWFLTDGWKSVCLFSQTLWPEMNTTYYIYTENDFYHNVFSELLGVIPCEPPELKNDPPLAESLRLLFGDASVEERARATARASKSG